MNAAGKNLPSTGIARNAGMKEESAKSVTKPWPA
jgi:hypothetical protein